MKADIAFNDIPDKLRVPGVYIEFDGRLAGRAVLDAKAIIYGQRLATGTVPAGTMVRLSADAADTESKFGRGAMLTEMAKKAKKAEPWLEIWAVALDDDGAGTAAVKKITVTGPATQAGTLPTYIGGDRVRTSVTSGDSATVVAAAMVDDINDAYLPFIAAVNGVNDYEVDLTCRWKGETGSDIDIRIGYYDTDKIPAGLGFTVTEETAGAGNPVITPAIDAMAGEWFNWIVCPYTDASNLTLLEAELGLRFGPMQSIGGRAFTAYKGTQAATGTFGNGRNCEHVTCMPTGASPTAPWIWAAVNGAVAGQSLSIDPARQLKSLVLPGILPPARADRWDDPSRNELLYDGVSTSIVDAGGQVRIEAQVTMYQINSGGVADDAWLYVNTPETLERIRLDQRHHFTQTYPRHKLAEDDVPAGQGSNIMQPKLAKVDMLVLYDRFIERGWCQDRAGYKATLDAQIDKDNSDRLNMYDSPKLINNMRITAIHSEFRK